jgi:hypothetical protein
LIGIGTVGLWIVCSTGILLLDDEDFIVRMAPIGHVRIVHAVESVPLSSDAQGNPQPGSGSGENAAQRADRRSFEIWL